MSPIQRCPTIYVASSSSQSLHLTKQQNRICIHVYMYNILTKPLQGIRKHYAMFNTAACTGHVNTRKGCQLGSWTTLDIKFLTKQQNRICIHVYMYILMKSLQGKETLCNV